MCGLFMVSTIPHILWKISLRKVISWWKGRIIEIKPFYGLDGLIYTNYGLEIHFVYKGVDVDNVVHFVSLGGTMEDEALVVCPSLHFQEGETGLVGLRDTRIPRVKEQCYIPVSADRSWLKINYTDRLAFDFHNSVLKLNDLRQKLQRLTKQPSWQVVAPPGESAQESMVTITGLSPTDDPGRQRKRDHHYRHRLWLHQRRRRSFCLEMSTILQPHFQEEQSYITVGPIRRLR